MIDCAVDGRATDGEVGDFVSNLEAKEVTVGLRRICQLKAQSEVEVGPPRTPFNISRFPRPREWARRGLE